MKSTGVFTVVFLPRGTTVARAVPLQHARRLPAPAPFRRNSFRINCPLTNYPHSYLRRFRRLCLRKRLLARSGNRAKSRGEAPVTPPPPRLSSSAPFIHDSHLRGCAFFRSFIILYRTVNGRSTCGSKSAQIFHFRFDLERFS